MNRYQRIRERFAPLEVIVDILCIFVLMFMCKILVELFPFGAMMTIYCFIYFNFFKKLMSYKGTRLDKGEKE